MSGRARRPPLRGTVLAWWGAAVAVAALAAGCGEPAGAGERSLRRLERLEFVPAGECVLSRGPRVGVDCSNPAPLLFDRFEVTRGEWLEFARAELELEAPEAARSRWREWGASEPDRPASWMNRDEARRFAQREGMRLPSAAEWMRVAAGTRAQRLPWGQPARSVSNSLDLGLGRTSNVGTFEHGGTVRGVQDLIGNVAEWVEGTLLEGRPEGETLAWAMGGSYLSHERALFSPSLLEPGGLEFNALWLDPAHRTHEVGVRLCAPAEEFLLAQARAWPAHGRTRARLIAVGARWGRTAVPLLEELSSRRDAPRALRCLLQGARG